MNFYLYKPILKFLLGAAILISSVFIIKLLLSNQNAIGKNVIFKNDSSLVDSRALNRFHKDVKDIPDKEGRESHSTLNSVNLIIYMINKVANKSLR